MGGRVVKMDRLRALFEELGLKNVRTYIQSGNVFFDASLANRAKLERTIEAHLTRELGYDVPVFVRTVDELEGSLAGHPFDEVRITPDVRLCVIFVSEPPPRGTKFPQRSPNGDMEFLKATTGEIFAVLRATPGRVPNIGAYAEKTFGVKATARFFHTTQKILEAAKSRE